MPLSELANIATIVEAIFVVVSVLFIWREARESTKITRAANTQSLVELSSSFNLQLIQDRQMAEYWVLGAKNYTQMDAVEKYRYISLLTWWLILHENIYYQWKNKLLSKDIYSAWANDLEWFVKEQRLWLHWGHIKSSFQSEFANLISQLAEKHRHTSYSGDDKKQEIPVDSPSR